LGLPLFVKGSVRSLKQFGIEACVGRDRDAVLRIVRRLFELPFHARGSVILRRLLPLRFERSTPEGFPLGREYRVFLYKSVVLDYGYYWEGSDPLERMSVIEESEMLGLAVEASRRLDVPYLAMDVGQVEGGEWFVIEPGDAQFAGFSKVNVLKLLSRLEEELSGGLEVE
jgi:hypothetical protein